MSPHIAINGPAGLGSYGAGFDAIGDVDGDGIDDLIIGTNEYSIFTPINGIVEVRSGATGALLYSLTSPITADGFGSSVAGVDDIDQDSTPDFVVGARYSSYQAPGNGRVDVYSGATGAFLLSLFGPAASAHFGTQVEHMGDTDGDGVTDLAVSAPGFGPAGSVFIYSGQTGAVLQLIQGTAGSPIGVILERTGDLDGDGVDDLVTGSPGPNISQGFATGFIEAYSAATGSLLFHVDGPNQYGRFGETTSRIGDVNADGVDDILVSAHKSNLTASMTAVGRVLVLSGVDGSVLHDLWGERLQEQFGLSALGIDDLTGDGVDEFLVGTAGGIEAGVSLDRRLYLYSGKTGEPLGYLTGPQGSPFGSGIRAAGDLDGNGLGDIVSYESLSTSSATPVTLRLHLSAMMTPTAISGGQANGADASLLINGIDTGSAAGPFRSEIVRGLPFSFDFHGAPFALYELYSSPTVSPGGWLFAGFGSLDIGTAPTFADIGVVVPGFTSAFPTYALDASGEARLTFYLPPSWPVGSIGGVQALIQRPLPWIGNVWAALTAAHELVLK